MKIFDCFSFFNEIELLKIRIELLYPHVDHFVICEANITHSGLPKPYCYENSSSEFSRWDDKIIYLKYEPDVTGIHFEDSYHQFNSNSAPWKVERGQRDYLWNYLSKQAAEDVAIVSDADEIWNPSLAEALYSSIKAEFGSLEMQNHYYFLNCLGIGKFNSKWSSSYFAKIGYLMSNPNLSQIRESLAHNHYSNNFVVENAGWHFSYLGGSKKVRHKIESFAHQELNFEEIKNLERLENCINLGIDYLHRDGHSYAFLPIERYPKKLAELMKENPGLCKNNLII
jgi:beta-1,4-mannosyl-glycoprotein beta-1,4-N-acetylglucosaminyltransferase